MDKGIFVLFIIITLACYIAAIVDIVKRIQKTGISAIHPAFLWIMVLIPVLGPIIYFSTINHYNKNKMKKWRL